MMLMLILVLVLMLMMKLMLDYPSRADEEEILQRMLVEEERPEIQPILGRDKLLALRRVVDKVYLDPKMRSYVIDLVVATRDPKAAGVGGLEDLISFGASPRATLFLARAAKAHAFLRGRGFVIPEDVKAIGFDVLRHRVILTYEAEAEEITTEDVIQKIFDTVEVP